MSNSWPTCTRDSSASPEAASWKAAVWPRAIDGRTRSETSPNGKTIVNRWNDEFDTRPAPDYFQSFGLGFYEYFQLAEDIGARPLPILNCGMACQFNSSETAAIDELNEYIQDALDLIEFANGPVTSPWGKLRAQMGHPAPFHLTMIGVGNEQWGHALHRTLQGLRRRAESETSRDQAGRQRWACASGEHSSILWSNWRKLKADIVDEHYYMSA